MLSQTWSAVLLVVLMAPASTSAEGGRKVRVRWTFAGSLIQNVARATAPPATPITIAGRTSIVDVLARGTPGRATIRVSGGGGSPLPEPPAGFPAPTVKSDPCAGLTTVPFPGENSLVAILHDDHSLLWGARDPSQASVLCTDPATSMTHGVVFMVFTGGTGQLEGARGRGVIVFHAQAVVPGSSFSIDTGSLVASLRVGDPD